MHDQIQMIEDLIGQLGTQLEEIESQCNYAMNEADCAEDQAASAQNSAYEAKNSAESADSSRADAVQTLNDIVDAFDALKLKLGGDGPNALDADIRKHRRRVLTMHAAHPHRSLQQLADALLLPELLVQQILAQSEAQAA